MNGHLKKPGAVDRNTMFCKLCMSLNNKGEGQKRNFCIVYFIEHFLEGSRYSITIKALVSELRRDDWHFLLISFGSIYHTPNKLKTVSNQVFISQSTHFFPCDILIDLLTLFYQTLTILL